MRVRIGYGVELEDIPELSVRELRKAIHSLSNRADDLEESINLLGHLADKAPESLPSIGTDVVNKVENLRNVLAAVDNTLSDFSAILKGYVAALEPTAALPPEPSSEPSDGE
jgi:hypothetical protein